MTGHRRKKRWGDQETGRNWTEARMNHIRFKPAVMLLLLTSSPTRTEKMLLLLAADEVKVEILRPRRRRRRRRQVEGNGRLIRGRNAHQQTGAFRGGAEKIARIAVTDILNS